MADWFKFFHLSPHIRVVATNMAPAGAGEIGVRLQARVFGHTVERTYPIETQAHADFEFGRLSENSIAEWLKFEGNEREAKNAGRM